MPPITYVFGHQRPDTDSICAALAYANLKRSLGDPGVIACRLGEVNKETQYALDYFNIDPPRLIKSVKPQVSDLNFNNNSKVYETDSVLKTMNLIIGNPGRSVPVVDEEDKLIGIISLPDIIEAYTGAFRKDDLKKAETPYQNILDILDARTIGRPESPIVEGDVYANTELTPESRLAPEDIVVVSVNSTLDKAFNSGARNIIISGVPIGFQVDVPEGFDGFIILSEEPTFEVIRLLVQVVPISAYVCHDNLEYFLTYETLDDVKKNMLDSSHDRFPVVDDEGTVLSSITKSSLLDYNRKKVILVDHNERTQSISGIEEAEITEVIDHHRIAEITTAAPLYLRIEPVGCTCTIITKMYHEKDIPIPRPIAGLLMSAILSDTLIFNSPTCTEADKKAVEELAEIAGVDPYVYGRNMIIAGSNLSDMTPKEIIRTDRKIFTMGNYRVVISQINTGDYKGLFDLLDPLLSQMEADCINGGFDLAVLIVSDVLIGGSELLIAGKARNLAKAAFGIEPGDISRFFPGMFSRKKQVVPPLMQAAASS